MSENNNGSVAKKALKVFGWTILTIVVVAVVLIFCAIKFLSSKDLAPIVEEIANEHIDGHLTLGKLKLGFHPKFPILGVEVDDLSLISHAFDSLPASQRGLLPNYADSLLTLQHMEGSFDIKRLLFYKELCLHDVSLRGLGINIVLAHNGKPNYDIVNIPPDTVQSSNGKMPSFRIDRFSLDRPKEIRFYNAADSTSASVLLLTDAAVEGEDQPTYRLKINGNVTSPKATLLTNLEQINFGVNGKVYWNPSAPGLVAMDEMELRGEFIKAIVSGEIDLNENLIVRKGTVELKPVAITDLITLLPDSIRKDHGLYSPRFATDAAIGAHIEILKPMNLATDTIPEARISINMSPSYLDYGKAHLKDISLEMTVNTVTNMLDKTTIDLKRFTVVGPGTQMELSAFLSSLISDPTFETNIEGKIDFRDLPPIIIEKIPGYLAGVIDANLKAKGSTSMLAPEHLHKLVADGTVDAKGIYFLSADTTKIVQIGNAKIELDSKRIVKKLPLPKTKISVDTATILVSGIDLALGSINLNAAIIDPSKSSKAKSDTTQMLPISGELKVGRFNITSITDSAGARIRNINGRVGVHGLKQNGKVPEIFADLKIGNVSAGSLSDRVLLHDTKVNATLYKLPNTSSKSIKPESKHKKPTSHKEYTYISPAEVHKYVYYKRKHGKHTKRVYSDVGTDDEELLVWNLTPQFSRFLNEWRLSGTLNSANSRLLTPFFPLRNSITTVALKFNNDTINISNISLRAGKSDLTFSGLISNVRRAMTSKTDNNLKGNFSLLSDTIDINELSASIFTGASYASDHRHGKGMKMATGNDDTLAANLDALSKKGPGRSSPVLIPVNIDANLKIEANHLLYSDLNMQDMGADVLVYGGGVNLHNLKAYSDAGDLSLSAIYSAPKVADMQFGFGLDVKDFNIAKFVRLVPAIDSITPLMHDFSGMIGANIAATCSLDSGMNIALPSLNAAIKIQGDNLAFIDPEKYRTLGKWLGFKNKADNTIHNLSVEMTVADGLMRVYPFTFNIDRYRLGVYGYNDIDMNFNYHLAVLKSPIPFKFGVTIKGDPKKYKVRFGGAKFDENTAIESVNIVNDARINLIDQIEGFFKRGVRNSRFAKLQIARPEGFDSDMDLGLSASDSLQLIKEGVLEDPNKSSADADSKKKEKEKKKKKHKRFLFF